MTQLRAGYRTSVFVSAHEKVCAEGCCRMCLRPWSIRPPTRHHLVSQSWFRSHRVEHPIRMKKNVPQNVVGLCWPCHNLMHHEKEARRYLRRSLVQSEIAFIVEMRGEKWLNKHYPMWSQGDPVEGLHYAA